MPVQFGAVRAAAKPAISRPELEAWRDLVESRYGLYFSDGRIGILRDAVRQSTDERHQSFSLYKNELKDMDPYRPEWASLIDRIVNCETGFFRHEPSYHALTGHLIPQLMARRSAAKERRLSFCSAGCSTGEEPFSIAMVLDQTSSIREVGFSVYGLDVCRSALVTAKAARYSGRSVMRVPADVLRRSFSKQQTAEGSMYEVSTKIRERVEFEHVNLADRKTYPAGPFDVIFCQNVLIYFQPARRVEVVEHLASLLAPNGYLIPGPGELAGLKLSSLQCVRAGDAHLFTRLEQRATN